MDGENKTQAGPEEWIGFTQELLEGRIPDEENVLRMVVAWKSIR